MIGRVIGNYQILKQIGEGGMGVVYLGEHPLIGKKIAVKVLDPELARRADLVARFFHEARVVNEIRHENIVDVIDFGRTPEGESYYIMELLEGETLRQRLRRTPVLSIGLAADMTVQAASALGAAHKCGIIHRDVKPDNIFLTTRAGRDHFVKVLDFGIAKLVTEGTYKTRTGAVIGTPAYMSPEQCQGNTDIDGRADVYALGMVLYQMLAGRVAFGAKGFTDSLIAHVSQQVPLLCPVNDQVTPELEALVLKCLEKKRERRFATMEQMMAALEPYLPQGARVAHAPSLTEAENYNSSPRVTEISAPAPAPKSELQTTPSGPMRPSRPSRAPSRPMSALRSAQVDLHAPQHTTFSGASGERFVASIYRTKPRMILGASAALFVAVVVVGFLTRGRPQNEPVPVQSQPVAVAPPSVQPVATPVPVIAEALISISSLPLGASVVRLDSAGVLGVTPLEVRVAKGRHLVEVELSKDGFARQRVSFVPDRDRAIEVVLTAVAPVAKPALAVPPKKRAPKRTPAKTATDDLGTLEPEF